ncbi:hypothetical protein FKM82_018543 [Ascaphus truei]|uniref:homeobox and leucine zipper protein Homez n=1 Tax=Ascaphus truei TaxID=8439 RepID=UPI003F5A6307
MSPTTTKDPGVCPNFTPELVCLPPISDDLQLIWTQPQLTNELDDHPQLVHTFSYFPYPSMPEIALLCLRYGLQMEKVKTWFMVQRIRCGISWSSEEIEETRSRLLYNQDQLHFKPLVALARKASGHQTPEKLSIPAPKSETRREISPPSPFPFSGNALPEAKRARTECMASERGPVRAAEFTPEHRMPSPGRAWDPSGTYGHHFPDSNARMERQPELRIPAKLLVAGQMFGVDGTEVSKAVACLPSEEELCRRVGTPSWNMDGFMASQGHGYQDHGGGVFRGDDCYMPVMRRQRKTKEQLTVLKSFFLQCQWARREDYQKLEEITGLPRPEIIQWFGDTRYALKHGQLKWFRDNAQGRPSWLDEPQHLIGQNGRPIEPKPGGSPGAEMAMPVVRVSGADVRTIIQPVRTLVAQAMATPVAISVVQMPVPNAAAASAQCSGTPEVKGSGVHEAKAPEMLDAKWAITSETPEARGTEAVVQGSLGAQSPFTNTSEPVGQVVLTALETVQTPLPPPSPIPAAPHRIDFGVLERYWTLHRHIQDVDLPSLVMESGLGRQQVLDWFCHKSSEPAEVEVCLDDEEEEDDDEEEMEEEEDDDVVIQD